MKLCLERLADLDLNSISIPSFGTGGLKVFNIVIYIK
jgi:hypothetical protein